MRAEHCTGRLGRGALHLLFLLALLPNREVRAGDVFSTMEIGLRLERPAASEEIHQDWEQGTGISLHAETPFHIGKAVLGIRWTPFTAYDAALPDFYTLFAYAGLGCELDFPLGLTGSGAVAAGDFLMSFERDKHTGGVHQLVEHELGIVLNIGIKRRIRAKLSLELSWLYQLVFTRRELELWIVSAGLSYAFSTPEWMREVLR